MKQREKSEKSKTRWAVRRRVGAGAQGSPKYLALHFICEASPERESGGKENFLFTVDVRLIICSVLDINSDTQSNYKKRERENINGEKS